MPTSLLVVDSVGPLEVLSSNSLEKSGDVLGGGGEVLDSNDSLEDGSGVGILGRDRDDSGAIDEVDSSHEGDVLPDLQREDGGESQRGGRRSGNASKSRAVRWDSREERIKNVPWSLQG